MEVPETFRVVMKVAPRLELAKLLWPVTLKVTTFPVVTFAVETFKVAKLLWPVTPKVTTFAVLATFRVVLEMNGTVKVL